MKIKVLGVVLFILLNGFLYSQNLDLRYYSDHEKGYRGYSSAIYIAKDLDEKSLEYVGGEYLSAGKRIDKLSKNNLWLCWKALDEWEIEEGEVYFILCTDDKYSDTGIMIVAVIENGGENFSWWGRLVSSGELQ